MKIQLETRARAPLKTKSDFELLELEPELTHAHMNMEPCMKQKPVLRAGWERPRARSARVITYSTSGKTGAVGRQPGEVGVVVG